MRRVFYFYAGSYAFYETSAGGAWNLYVYEYVEQFYVAIDHFSKSMYNFPVALSMLNGVAWRKDYGVIMLATVFAVLPILIIFLVFQKQFVAGVMGGAVKE